MISIGRGKSLHEKISIAYRAIGMLLLYILWAKTGSDVAGLFLFLALLILMLIRWRFPRLKWMLVIDQLVVIGVSYLWQNSVYALALGVFEAAYLGCPFFVLPAVFYTVLYNPEGFLFLLLTQSAFTGIALWGWRKQQESAFRLMDEERRRHYKTERLKQELLAENVQVVRMVELSERSRIAREIHDDAGHEIVAAYMSLQTVQTLFETDAIEAEEVFCEAIGRLESGIGKIREAVHNLTPLTEIGVDDLRRLIDRFSYCPIEFTVYGNTSQVSVYLWVILEACLKEALTNVMRHADAKIVKATLDITPYIVRLCVENDGVRENSYFTAGLGFRNLQQRAAAVGGNISTSMSESFCLVCVLPIL